MATVDVVPATDVARDVAINVPEMNTIGRLFRLTTFGESHGQALGGIIDGCPSGKTISLSEVQRFVDRRRPGQSDIASPRHESDKVEILSGLFDGVTTGMPIAFLVRNEDQRPADYDTLRHVLRPGHADLTWYLKYNTRDHRGGGRASAREHVCRVVGGAIAMQLLAPHGITVTAYVDQVGDISLGLPPTEISLGDIEATPVRCPSLPVAERMADLIRRVHSEGDSIGGAVACIIRGLPAGLGEPVFDRFQARLAYYMMSINAAKGFEYGEGFRAATMRGSQHNDPLGAPDRHPRSLSNHAGGLLGGVTTGDDLYFRVAFKPTPSISRPQHTVDIHGRKLTLANTGRHDPCVVPRAVPVVEAMAAMLVLDMLLENNSRH